MIRFPNSGGFKGKGHAPKFQKQLEICLWFGIKIFFDELILFLLQNLTAKNKY